MLTEIVKYIILTLAGDCGYSHVITIALQGLVPNGLPQVICLLSSGYPLILRQCRFQHSPGKNYFVVRQQLSAVNF
jgi:hypothetical protein